MVDSPLQVADVARAAGRVLDVDPAVIRADTPLLDVGADDVAVIAIVDLLSQQLKRRLIDDLATSTPVPQFTTVGDLVEFLT